MLASLIMIPDFYLTTFCHPSIPVLCFASYSMQGKQTAGHDWDYSIDDLGVLLCS
jgi:hypothetical protein